MRNLIKTLIIATLGAFIGCHTVQAQTKRALLIGISDYGNAKEDPNLWSNISGANDVALLTPLLKSQGYKVAYLTDAQATYSGITNALKKVVKHSQNGDIVYVHFSMHGQPYEDLNGDEEDGWDEALIPVDAQMTYSEGVYDGKNHLLDDELEKHFNDIRNKLGPNGHLYVILDACHSGTASRGDNDHIRGTQEGFSRSGKFYSPDRTKETNDYFTVATSKGQSPVTFIEACRSYQVNREVRDVDTNTWYGSLSYYIAKAIMDNKILGSDEWLESVRRGMGHNRKLRKQNVVVEKSE